MTDKRGFGEPSQWQELRGLPRSTAISVKTWWFTRPRRCLVCRRIYRPTYNPTGWPRDYRRYCSQDCAETAEARFRWEEVNRNG